MSTQTQLGQPETDVAWPRLANAVAEIVTNPATPSALYNDVMAFLNSEGSGLWGKLITMPPMIQKILIEARINQEDQESSLEKGLHRLASDKGVESNA
jgi:hypothetical protein